MVSLKKLVLIALRIKSAVEPKRCLILDVGRSSLEVDLRVPGNRDEFLFSQAEWSLPSLFSPVSREVQFSARKPIVTNNAILTFIPSRKSL